MEITNFSTRQKPFVELKKGSKRIEKYTVKKVTSAFKSESGGGLGIIFIGLAVLLLAFAVFINIADYALFTYKRNAISKSMDYAVTAAVQQINKPQSIVGVANGFAEETGDLVLKGIEIDIDIASRTFLTMFYANYCPDNLIIDNKLLVCVTSTKDEKLSYTIKANTQQTFEGTLDNSALIEQRINEAIEKYWPSTQDNSQVYISGNPKTNMIENGTYLFAFIKDIKITGLYSQRKINLSSFAGAKLERF